MRRMAIALLLVMATLVAAGGAASAANGTMWPTETTGK